MAHKQSHVALGFNIRRPKPKSPHKLRARLLIATAVALAPLPLALPYNAMANGTFRTFALGCGYGFSGPPMPQKRTRAGDCCEAQNAKPPPWGAWRRRFATSNPVGMGGSRDRVRLVNATGTEAFLKKLTPLLLVRTRPADPKVFSSLFAGKQIGPSAAETALIGKTFIDQSLKEIGV